MAGYVGRGMLTAAVAGEIFASPPTEAVLAAIRTVTHSAGALIIVMNYTGDALCAHLRPPPSGSLCHILASLHVKPIHFLPGMSMLQSCDVITCAREAGSSWSHQACSIFKEMQLTCSLLCTGDRLNFGLAVEQARSEGYKVSITSTVMCAALMRIG